MENKMKVYIHPSVNVLYSSMYIQALEERFGARNIYYTKEPFRNVPIETQLLFIVEDKAGNRTRYAVDSNDFNSVKDGVYAWCDVYGHCNANRAATPEHLRDKLVSLCPSFGVRCWTPIQIGWHALVNMLKMRPSSKELRHFVGKYKRLWTQRRWLEDYYTPTKTKHEQPYVFFCSTLWYNDEWNKNDEGVNKTRANFIRACKSIGGLTFEGGLVPQSGGRSSVEKFADVVGISVGMDEWMEKTKQSDIVFNTPAFWGCHGWKLGEYLALGKCIVSTKLSNDLPEPLVHGENIHFVEDSEEAMREAIQYIITHPKYQHKLEDGARTYWQKYGTPEACLKTIGIHEI